MKEVSAGVEQTQTLRRAINTASAAATLFVATVLPMRNIPNASQTQSAVAHNFQQDTGATFPFTAGADTRGFELINDFIVTTTEKTDTVEVSGDIVVTPPNSRKASISAWDAIAEFIGSVEGPKDWAENHDKYLYKVK